MNKPNPPSPEIHDHKTNPANDRLEVSAMDEPGDGGANHCYAISGFDTSTNPSEDGHRRHRVEFVFQHGPIPEKGVNGVTNEALLAILIHRMRGFQSGPFACRENACALTHMEEALMWLQKRTLDRMRRGVEGTHKH